MNKFDLKNIRGTIDHFESIDFKYSELYKLITGHIERTPINGEYIKFALTLESDSVKKVIVDCLNDDIMSICFIGKLNIKVEEVVDDLMELTKYHSNRDNLYFYHTIKKHGNKNYKISFYSETTLKLPIDTIWNIAFSRADLT